MQAFQSSSSPNHLSLITDADSTSQAGVLLPVLRQEHWIVANHTVRKRLLPEGASDKSPGPWLTLGLDTPECLDTLLESEVTEPWADLMATARHNLGRRSLDVQQVGPNLLCVTDEYAAEAVLLLSEVSNDLAERLGCDELAVCAVGPGAVLVGALFDSVSVAVQIDWAKTGYERRSGRRISRVPLVVSKGKVTGPVDVDSVPKLISRPWWHYW